MITSLFFCLLMIGSLELLLVEGLNPPNIKPFHFSGDLREGLRTAVICVIVDGDRPFDFKWFKDADPLLQEKGHFSIQIINEFTSILNIERLNAESNGNYTCRVTNSVGSDEKSDVLMMKGEIHFTESRNGTHL
ncbi:titin [Nephila pilipes]|uniref:Titin n=1 Tax=Nephila pilipes TaxID=299642 RepID=A0A8X6THA8_NEPPI|nr:titin [Nephila pilipes]